MADLCVAQVDQPRILTDVRRFAANYSHAEFLKCRLAFHVDCFVL